MRTFGLDYGTKTIGVAVSDGLGLTAQAVTTVRRTSLKGDLAELSRLVKEHEVTRFVLGLPLNMNGSEGPRAEATRKFAEVLASALGLPVELWDERLSTVAAQRTLLEADVRRREAAGGHRSARRAVHPAGLAGRAPPQDRRLRHRLRRLRPGSLSAA